ncbi:NAD(+) synthase [Helcococcus sueciensis]|uniref:NAD(+) synthase n=1 Tax=Helcococcus sueciensis TaxID=241555 RepID=UPI0003F5C1FF|nr:NAD(+) synthase [Helcococcus sueciensis]
MYKNFLRIASANINIKLLNIEANKSEIIKYINYAAQNGVDILLFPELTLTGVSSGEYIATKEIVKRSYEALKEIVSTSKNFNTIIYLGLPTYNNGKYYNTMLSIQNGNIIGGKSKSYLNKFEQNIFNSFEDSYSFEIDGTTVNINHNFMLNIKNCDITIDVQFENLVNYANIDSNNKYDLLLIPGSETRNALSLDSFKYNLINLSKNRNNVVVYAGPSSNESSSNAIYSSQKYIVSNGEIIEQGKDFLNGIIYNDFHLSELKRDDVIFDNFFSEYYNFETILEEKEIPIKRKINPYPYFPTKENWNSFMRNIVDIQSEALARRMRQIPDKKIYLGLSGGLDSTLALIIASLTYYKLGYDSKDIHAVTMPGLGTSQRTRNNAIELANSYNVTLEEISIKDSVIQHFKDINHDENQYDVTFENSQARERTQVLMDLANKHGGIVLGTGNMSEIALGWSTYNGDHMSMYSINCGLPKTLLREVVKFIADTTNKQILKDTLLDIVDTPISPELLPTNESGEIEQKTENNVGPYELHDFFIYHLIKNKLEISEIQNLCEIAFADKYSKEEISKWYIKFLSRFITQQFKRNVAPDGPQILDYSLNPKFGFTMPSDIDANALLMNVKRY